MTPKTKTTNPLPNTDPLPGSVFLQWIPRGPNGKQCGPYHYRMWRDDRGILRKQYVKSDDVEAVTARCNAYRELRRAERAAFEEATRLRIQMTFERRLIEGKTDE